MPPRCPVSFRRSGGSSVPKRLTAFVTDRSRGQVFSRSTSDGGDRDMNGKPASWPPSAIVLAVAGVLLIGTGLYFILIRPPLLPEDTRFMAITAAQLDAIRPRMEMWLTHVFRVMGGYVMATGVLAVTLAATSFRRHSLLAGL